MLDSGVKLYSTGEVGERNATFEVAKYLPSYVAIGDDSGGNAFVMSVSPQDRIVYVVGQGVMDSRYMRTVADDIPAWLAHLETEDD